MEVVRDNPELKSRSNYQQTAYIHAVIEDLFKMRSLSDKGEV